MDSHQLIDAQFDRAVQVIQGLPKTGPIQTGYDEKLTMYSLYKQATVGNVTSPRPGIWDMLGRAKWDAWAKHKDLDSYEAKWLYVDALLKVLRRYSDKTVARDLVRELESYGGDTKNLVLSRTLDESGGSQSSGSTVSDDDASPSQHHSRILSHQQQHLPDHLQGEQELTSEEETDDEAPAIQPEAPTRLYPYRPQSSVSSHRYRTPVAQSLSMSPRPTHSIPAVQPMPGFETPSAFADPSSSAPSSSYRPTNPYANPDVPRALMTSPPMNIHPAHPLYRGQPPFVIPQRPGSRQQSLELAINNVQAYLAALTERLDALENPMHPGTLQYHSRSHSYSEGLSPVGGRGSPASPSDAIVWDVNDLGLWSIILKPLSRGAAALKEVATFFAHSEDRTPTATILRRLCLDVSFLMFVVGIVRLIWRRSGVRRREVLAALIVLWRAMVGAQKERIMVAKGV